MCAFIGKPACTVASTDRDHSFLRRRWSALACRLSRVRAFWAGERRLPSVFFMAKNPAYLCSRARPMLRELPKHLQNKTKTR